MLGCLEPQLLLVDVGAETKLGTQPLSHLPSLMRAQFNPVQMSCRGHEPDKAPAGLLPRTWSLPSVVFTPWRTPDVAPECPCSPHGAECCLSVSTLTTWCRHFRHVPRYFSCLSPHQSGGRLEGPGSPQTPHRPVQNLINKP